MEEFQDQLRSSISAVLSSLSADEVNGVINTLQDAGVESLPDLEFVREEDLRTLKPIQRRKLVRSWTTKSLSFDLPEFHLPKENKFGKQIKQRNNLLKKNKWSKKCRSKLLEIFSEYKTQFYCPEKVCFWQDIAREMKKGCVLDIDFIECYVVILRLMHSFLLYRRDGVTTNRGAKMYDEMQNAFEIPGDTDCLNVLDSLIGQLFLLNTAESLNEKINCKFSGKKKWMRQNRIKLLQIFSRYKTQFCSDTNGENLWKGIADDMNRICSQNLDPEVYRFEIFQLINTYTNLRITGVNTARQGVIYAEMHNAFNMVLGDEDAPEVSDD